MGNYLIDYDSFIGQSFGEWTVIGYESVPRPDKPHQSLVMLRCACSCGVEKLKRKHKLVSGKNKGCYNCTRTSRIGGTFENIAPRDSRAYRAWNAMKARCDNPNTENYPFYGGRGVTYCERWKYFDYFFEDMGEKPEGYQLDKDKKGGLGCKLYSPENCCWLSPEDNYKHRRKDIRHLTSERINLIHKLYESGHTISDIHRTTGHTPKTIRKALSNYQSE